MDRSWAAVPVGIIVGVGIAALAPLPAPQARMLGITLFCIALWIGTPVPPWYTGVVAVGLIGAAFSPALALDGFAEPATWLVVFGLVVGEATRRSGLAAAFQAAALARMGAGTDARRAYRRLLAGLCAAGLAFALVLPSSLVRVLILAPILVEIGEAFDDERARRGLFLGPLFATFFGGTGVLTANVPNIVIDGLAESTAGLTISWTEWFVALFPIMGAGRTALIAVAVYLLYRPDPDVTVTAPAPAAIDPAAKRMLGFLAVGVAVWSTDAIHGLHPVFGALLVAALALLPRVGAVPLDAVEDVDFSIVFFVGAVFAIAAGLTETGFTDVAAAGLLDRVPADSPDAVLLGAVFAVTAGLAFLLEGAAVASVLTPILLSFAEAVGLSLTETALVEAAALGSYVFPYQSVVLVAILRFSVADARDLIRVAALVWLVTAVVLLPLQIAYFALL